MQESDTPADPSDDGSNGLTRDELKAARDLFHADPGVAGAAYRRLTPHAAGIAGVLDKFQQIGAAIEAEEAKADANAEAGIGATTDAAATAPAEETAAPPAPAPWVPKPPGSR